MAEGRWLPWKEQELDVRPTPDYKHLLKPLRPPPYGLEWRRLADGAWELRSTNNSSSQIEGQREDGEKVEDCEETVEGKEHAPEFLEHVVMPDDTLVGICLKYKVKDRELRRLNGFVGNHFRMCETLVIPNKFSAGQQPTQDNTRKPPMTRQEMVQSFRKVSQLGPEEARYYLESSGWELSKALSVWRLEDCWEAEQVKAQSTGTIRRRTAVQPGTGGRGNHQAVTGTVRADTQSGFGQVVDHSIELSNRGDVLAEARVPLLANRYV